MLDGKEFHGGMGWSPLKEVVLKPWFVYILCCADDTLYTGVSTDVLRRVAEHNAGVPAGARYTHARRPVVLVFQECAVDRGAALRREKAIKSFSRKAKLALIAGGATVAGESQDTSR